MTKQPATVVDAVQRDLAQFGPLANSALAATALELARQLDSDRNSATSKSMCANALGNVMDRLRELAPPKKEADSLDDLAARRSARRGHSAA